MGLQVLWVGRGCFSSHVASRWHRGCCVGGQRALTLTFVGLRTIREASVPNVAFEKDGLCIRRRDSTLVATSIQSQGHRSQPTDRHAKMTEEAIGHAGIWRKVQVVELYPETQGTPTWALFIRMQ